MHRCTAIKCAYIEERSADLCVTAGYALRPVLFLPSSLSPSRILRETCRGATDLAAPPSNDPSRISISKEDTRLCFD